MAVRCRFDDLRRGTALAGRGLRGVVEANAAGDVAAALEEVEAATRKGLYAAGLVAYEAAPGLDAALSVCDADAAELRLPLVWFGLYSALDRVPPVSASPPAPGDWSFESTSADHAVAVERVRQLIAEGSTYQVNLTTRLRRPLEGPLAAAAMDLYLQLAQAQRAEFHALIETEEWAVASGSPELFFSLAGERVVMRPMKGTAARGRYPAEDAALAQWLKTSEKDRAENVMIVDLVRNDLGRVATTGSVEVEELCALERYRTVWQLTSTVSCRLAPGNGLVELMRALFPSGSVTGAPKASTMAIIAGLERVPRGPYCGAVGFVLPPGEAKRAVFSVAIRTATLDARRGLAEYGVGGGITWDSLPEAEWREVEAKSAVLFAPPEPSGLIETLAYLPDEGLRHLEGHVARIKASAAHFGWPFDDERLRSRLERATADAGAATRVRALLSPTGEIDIDCTPLGADGHEPVRLALDNEPVDSSNATVFHKTADRAWLERRAARHPEADDVVLCNERGEVTETARANIAAEIDGHWLTPPLTSGLLAGVERQHRLERGLLREAVLTVDDLRAATRLAVMSSPRGWRAATLVTT